jgi:hypothetical protein
MKGWLKTMNKKYKKTLNSYEKEKKLLNDRLNKKIIILDIIPKINNIKCPIYSNIDNFFKKLQKILGFSDIEFKTKKSSIVIGDHEIFLGTTFGSIDELDEMFINWNNLGS